ncbi:hypothetical protein E2E30_13500 [Sphingomonas sp. AAP5]|uniref:hypothetical protein n=1 Tax=Sphingomonas sp. AAP5 TaxID=1523415 RepID=UPI001056FE37|nr:hypothetical protein [Sphingomonas sp. AAP5]QBM76666.1 hypothetical protein E2E30_13500 [Sphingomonas sp. AAP5]
MPHRPLSPGELHHAQALFGDAIAYDGIKVHARRYLPFQPRGVAMAPNGHIYFPKPSYKPDFSTTVPDLAWILHELTHVWQHQHGMWVRLRGTLAAGRYHYGDLADTNRPFTRFNIEQQAAIVGDYVLTTNGFHAQHGRGARADYERVLPFIGGG